MRKQKKFLINNQKFELDEQNLSQRELKKLHLIETKQELIRFAKYAFFASSAGVIQAVSLVFLQEVVVLEYWLAYGIALTLSVLWSFTFNRKFTFKSSNNIPLAMIKIALFYAVFAPATIWGVKILTGEDFKFNPYIVEASIMVSNFILEAIYYRFVVFGSSINTNEYGQKENSKILKELGINKKP